MDIKHNKPHIILIHGLWMSPLFLLYYYRRLKNLNYNVHLFSYSPTMNSWDKNLRRLNAFIENIPHQHVHFIAHSLGGLLICDYLQKYTPDKKGRAIVLASPIAGSSTAKRLSRYYLGRKLLGNAREILCKPRFSAISNWEIASIAGTWGLGISRILGKLPQPHDGAISVSETKRAWLTDHLVLPVSHSGILISSKAASQSINFIEHGTFHKDKPRYL